MMWSSENYTCTWKSVFISVYEPAVVKNQMLLSQFVMMKMFLSGIISGNKRLAHA